MREVLTFPPADVLPSTREVLGTQGVPLGASVPARVTELATRALRIVGDLARPRAVVEPVPIDAFRTIFHGEGHNEDQTPLACVVPDADRLVLFAATLGGRLSAEIDHLFQTGDIALAAMLDGAASEGAERLVATIERHTASDGSAVLAYSPGYCGWHVTGQRRLFTALEPEEIGITLNASCLMSPLKSVSGVLVAGPPEIHDVDDDFPCCSGCATRECRARIARILEV